MKLLRIGKGSFVVADRVTSVWRVNGKCHERSRMILGARVEGKIVDCTRKTRTRSVIVTDSGHVFLSDAGNR